MTFTLQTLTNNEIIRKIILFHVPILFCLLILTDHETNYSETETEIETSSGTSTKRHLAVFTALSRHPPSMRVYRGLIELIILSFCASLSLYVWECVIVDKTIIKELMFAKPYTLLTSSLHGTEISTCHVVVNANDECDYDDSMRGIELEKEKINYNKVQKEEEIIQHNDDEDDMLINNYNDNNDQIMPTSTSLLNKSLDYLLLFLISLFLFTISSSAGGQYIDQTNTQKSNIDQNKNQLILLLSQISLIAAPIFPLVLFFFFILHLFFPWNTSRYHFWTCISYTIGAPFYDVSFRDGFIGDIFTSMVRPMQDLAYTSFYLMSGLQGWWIVHRNNNNNDLHKVSSTTFEEDVILQPVEHSWLLHTIILPACMVSPLWWRYCQTLRQCYDTKKRWPYLGNALKYFLAAQVVILSVFFEPKKQNYFYIWIGLYVVATIYQIAWDIFMDWEMFVLSRRKDDGTYYFELRKDRLYEYKSVYIGILILNIILRFGWILNFIPMEYLSQMTGVLEYTFSADFATFVSPLLACAEIIRRTMWGFLRFELEALKNMKRDKCIVSSSVNGGNIESEDSKIVCNDNDDVDDGLEMKPMSIATTVNNPTNMMSFKSLSSVTFRNDLSTATDVQILWELCAYATIFMCTGIIAGIHREVL